jgi:hypothetical protein
MAQRQGTGVLNASPPDGMKVLGPRKCALFFGSFDNSESSMEGITD